jgi:hypothetical protein
VFHWKGNPLRGDGDRMRRISAGAKPSHLHRCQYRSAFVLDMLCGYDNLIDADVHGGRLRFVALWTAARMVKTISGTSPFGRVVAAFPTRRFAREEGRFAFRRFGKDGSTSRLPHSHRYHPSYTGPVEVR